MTWATGSSGWPQPDTVRAASRHLTALATGLAESAAGYTALRSDRWTGPAADAARARFAAFAQPLPAAAESLHRAAGALAAHAAVLDEVLVHLQRAAALEARLEVQRAAEARAAQEATLALRPVPLATTDPLEAIVPALRADAQAMALASARATAAVLADLVDHVPTAHRFAPRELAVVNADEYAGPDGTPSPGYRPRWEYRASATESQARWEDRADGVAGGHLDDTLDGCGLLPFLGLACDAAHLGLDVARGRWGDAGWGLLGTVPVAGDAVQGGRLATRLSRAAERGIDATSGLAKAADDAHEVYDKGPRLLAALSPAARPAPGGDPLWVAALREEAGGPDAPSATDDVAWQVVTDPATRWTGALVGPHVPLASTPSRLTARGTVAEHGRLVTYEVPTTPTGQPLGAPRAVASRPLPPAGAPARRVRRADDRYVVERYAVDTP